MAALKFNRDKNDRILTELTLSRTNRLRFFSFVLAIDDIIMNLKKKNRVFFT
ncbi:hypothetical protein QE380_003101 [Acinetobacter baylyi]|uniref:Transposase n=1 Tax=Acinetobacter baylyi TaxID=202950 RepID=A0ABU0V104_ACIBI|nr:MULTISPECIES: hypothetical protein [Acinetobacter]MDQ1210178.1 hypothetical protein [Acinetobacter baylyi]MDR6106227.1 hypothetical protein [Acinetobacter baylyi]MDR6187047.1 hypothetical protein [Acinetobacter baylyi]